jgi:outer membrane protein OmpA-like peptidoglycan-associated protein
MSGTETIRRDSMSYRQGVVLGLTMAETLLLLVFCLLIAAASIFAHKVTQLETLEAENLRLIAARQDALDTVSFMQSEMPNGAITDDWKRIVQDYAPAIQKMKEAGITIKEASEAADVVAAVIRVRKEGAPAEDVTAAIELQHAIRREFSASPSGLPNNEQITSLIREGRQVQTAAAGASATGRHDGSQIITLSEADGYYFDIGSAALSPKFRTALSGLVIEELLGKINESPDVNVIEVIGHTDEQPLMRRPSNLDEMLMPVLQGKASVVGLVPADNAGLGLARAISVSQILLDDKRLSSRFAVLPYSGAQLVNVNDSLVLAGFGGDIKERRRIEIRVRKSDKVGLPVALPPDASARKRRASAPPHATTSTTPAPNSGAAVPRGRRNTARPAPSRERLWERLFGK